MIIKVRINAGYSAEQVKRHCGDRKGKMMYKLLLADIDGTLRDECMGIPDSAAEALRLCRKNGCRVVICTGRSKGTVPDEVLRIEADGYITGDGCRIEFNHSIVEDCVFDINDTAQAARLLLNSGTAFALESCDTVFMNKGAVNIFTAMNEAKKKNAGSTDKSMTEKIIYRDNIHEYSGEKIHKICFWGTENLFRQLECIFGGKVKLTQKSRDYYEMVCGGCGKGAAAEKLQQMLGISKEETICFGDGQNDLEMFKASGTAVAMPKGNKKLKALAASICEDIFENGIYNELKRRNMI